MKRNPALPSEPLREAARMRGVLLDFPLIAQKTNFTCGPAVVRAVAKYHGLKVSEHRARMLMDTSERHGTTPANMRRYLKYLGLDVRMRRNTPMFTIKLAIARGYPVIVLWNDWKGHYAVCVGYDKGHMLLADPANRKSGMRVHKVKNFRKHWHAKVAGQNYRQLAIICYP